MRDFNQRGETLKSDKDFNSETSRSSRRKFLQSSLLGGAMAGAAVSARSGQAQGKNHERPAAHEALKPFEFDEITITALQDGMKSGKYSSHSIVEKYLARIKSIDKSGPAINSIIELNPDALAIADELDKERKAKGPRGPMHGVPVLIKD